MLKNKTIYFKKETTVVYFRYDPDNGSEKCAKLFFMKA